METNELQVQAGAASVGFNIILKSFYCSFSGQIEVTPILNAGEPEERLLAKSTSPISHVLEGDFTQEGSFQDFITANPDAQTLINLLLQKAATSYQS